MVGDRLGGLDGFGYKLVGWEDLADQTRLLGFLRCDLVSGEHHLHGLGLADGFGQSLRATSTWWKMGKSVL